MTLKLAEAVEVGEAAVEAVGAVEALRPVGAV